MTSLLAFTADLARAALVAIAARLAPAAPLLPDTEDERGYRLARVEDAANEVMAEIAEPVDWAIFASDWEIEQAIERTRTKGWKS